MNEREDVVVLEWKFSPLDYFEESIQINRDDYVMSIDKGTVEARIRPEVYDKDQNMRDKLTAALNDRFLGVQLFSHKTYELSKASMYRLHPDGRRDVTMFLEPGVLKVTGKGIDFTLNDKDGNVIRDSKRERIQKKQEFAELAEKYRQRNTLVASMLQSYNNAVNDPDNELVHLYEIRESLAKQFGGESAALNILGIGRNQWRLLGKLANDEPLRQGRHRGKNPGVLRNATDEELSTARSIARDLAWAYLNYLDSSK